MEEERRLFYVALTRPRQTLTIYSPVRYYHRPTGHDDAHGYGKHSRFPTEHAETLCDTTNLHHDDQTPAPHSSVVSARVEVDLTQLWQ